MCLDLIILSSEMDLVSVTHVLRHRISMYNL
jgi:hypothetical protein